LLTSVPKQGDRPIRKRAFYRALKRGELWAIVPYEYLYNGGLVLALETNRFAKIIPDKHCLNNAAYIMWPFEEN
jgi:hypothetical protein